MAVRLVLPKEPYWDNFASGVRMKVRPLSAPARKTALYKAQERLRKLIDEARETEALGGSVEGLPDLTDPVSAAAVLDVLYARELGHAGILEWTGVVDADKQPADLCYGSVEAYMMLPGRDDDFVAVYTSPTEGMVVEEKPLPTALNGGSAEVGTIATDASPSKGLTRKKSRNWWDYIGVLVARPEKPSSEA